MGSLDQLSNELIALIAGCCHAREKAAFAATNKQYHAIINPLLYKFNVNKDVASAFLWAAKHGRVDTMERLVEAGAEVNDMAASMSVKQLTPRDIVSLSPSGFSELHGGEIPVDCPLDESHWKHDKQQLARRLDELGAARNIAVLQDIFRRNVAEDSDVTNKV
ncbi:Uu.00g067570.m01.CDS01 [Anthostomella pinea]|uniref:Uu.00g067570.m01.CDS01 n=1 Tax=Anthostomella pinea TaxID=933095 RepID=A0AAI8YKZ7_9PEZI|nr:Uu.00g067570.m01.CDS01 [Anthostomella pinea]